MVYTRQLWKDFIRAFRKDIKIIQAGEDLRIDYLTGEVHTRPAFRYFCKEFGIIDRLDGTIEVERYAD